MVNLHCRLAGRALPSLHVRSPGNEMGPVRSRRSRVGTGCGAVGSCLGMAGRWPCPPGVLGRGGQVRRGPASWNRHRGRVCGCDPCSGHRRGDLRRPGADARPHRDDLGGRAQGVAHSPRHASGQSRRSSERRRSDRCSRDLGRPRARRSVRPSGGQSRRRRDIRGPARPASAAECTQPSAGTRGAARTLTSAGARRACTIGYCAAAL